MTHPTVRLAALLSTLVLSPVLHAQTPPPLDAGGALREGRPMPPATPRAAPEPVIVQPQERPLALPGGQTLRVDAFRFEGDDFIAEAALQEAVAAYRGRALSMADIDAAADRVTQLYRDQGYLVARAYVPRQDARNGVLTMQIVAGRYGKVAVRNQSLVDDARIERHFGGLLPQRPVTRAELEEAMLRVGDLPGASLPRVNIAAGSTAGTSDFDIVVEPGNRYGGYAMVDNHGSVYTGENRLSLGAALNSPFALGDKLDFSGMASSNGDLLSGRLAYAAPLGDRGLRGELAASNTRYELGGVYAGLQAQGRASSLEANFSYPIQRSRAQNLTASFGLAGRHLRDEINATATVTTKKAYVATLGLAQERYGRWLGRDAYLSLNGSLTWGNLKIDDPAARAANQAGANTVGGFGRVNLAVQGRVALTGNLSVLASLGMQHALNRNLDSSEQMHLGGARRHGLPRHRQRRQRLPRQRRTAAHAAAGR